MQNHKKILLASIGTSNIQYHYLAVIGFNEYMETLSWTIGPWHCTAASQSESVLARTQKRFRWSSAGCDYSFVATLKHRSGAQRLEAEWVKWQLSKSRIFFPSDQANMTDTVYQFEAMDNQGRALNLDSLRGKVILVVNVASKWA